MLKKYQVFNICKSNYIFVYNYFYTYQKNQQFMGALMKQKQIQDREQLQKQLDECNQKLDSLLQKFSQSQQEVKQVKQQLANKEKMLSQKQIMLQQEMLQNQINKSQDEKKILKLQYEHSIKEKQRQIAQQKRKIQQRQTKMKKQNIQQKNKIIEKEKAIKKAQIQLAQSEESLTKITQEYNQSKLKIQQLQDPKRYQQITSQLFTKFLGQLTTFSMKDKIPKPQEAKYVVIMGDVSAGKSSIYNWLFNLKLATGTGETTQTIQKVYHQKEKKIMYFDSPGLHDEINIIHAQTLLAFYQCDQVFIASDRTFKSVKKPIQVMNKINPPKLYLLRTQCDKMEEKQLSGQKVKDKKILESWKINRQVLYISSHKGDNYLDNKKFKQLILN